MKFDEIMKGVKIQHNSPTKKHYQTLTADNKA